VTDELPGGNQHTANLIYPGRPLLEVTVFGIKFHDGRGRGLGLLAASWLVTQRVTCTTVTRTIAVSNAMVLPFMQCQIANKTTETYSVEFAMP
jgi:hypothetical protein